MTYQRILVPFDGSKYAKKALGQAVEIAKLGDGAIYLCTIVNVGSVVPPGSLLGLVKSATEGTLQKRLLRSAKTEAQKMHDDIVKNCKTKGVSVYPKIIIDGDVTQEILSLAKKKSIDLIVVGSQGLHGIGRLKSLGSVSRKVSEHASCPVLIVR